MSDTAIATRAALLGLLLIVVGYFLVAGLYAAQTPAWQAPDEPAHYNYIRQLAGGRLPVMEPHDYDEAYRAEIVSAHFAAPYSIEPLTYEDWQPPLYYLLQTPLYLLFEGALLPLRLFSVLLGAGVVLTAFAVARKVWPTRMWLALTAAAFVAFLPQHVAMLAAVNNDSLAELLIGALLWILLVASSAEASASPGRSGRWWFLAGILLGLGFLTKATVYIMVPVVALTLLWQYRLAGQALLRRGLLVFGPAFLLGALWWGRNLVVYGGMDVLGKQAHDAAVVGQKQTSTWLAEVGLSAALRSFLQTTFQSFWGQFGWMGVVMDSRVYLVLLLFSGLVFAGLLWYLAVKVVGKRSQAGASRPSFQSPLSTLQITILVATFLLSLGLYLAYNVTYVQHQGRYLFPALIPIGLAVALGLAVWVWPVVSARPKVGWLLPAGLALALVALDLLALFQFIVPALTEGIPG